MRSVLISGAGVAGPVLAFHLARHGFRPTVVERARGQRSSGNPVDVRGPALPVVRAMGLTDRLRAAATQATALRLISPDGRTRARLPISSRSGDIEVPRADLAAILAEAAHDDAEFIYDDTITTLSQDAGGVDVTFEKAAPQRFDLVVGADGLHSAVRRLAFGPESGYLRHLGLYVATVPLDEPAEHPHDVVLYNAPGRLLALHPVRGRSLVAFIFRGPAGATDHRRLLAETYSGDPGWRSAELQQRACAAGDLYSDAVGSVVLPSWSRGRVTLLGDAAAAVSLLGDGSSTAIAGASRLAAELAGTDHETALRRYETAHRRLTDPKRRTARFAAAALVPSTRAGIAARNATARLMLGRAA